MTQRGPSEEQAYANGVADERERCAKVMDRNDSVCGFGDILRRGPDLPKPAMQRGGDVGGLSEQQRSPKPKTTVERLHASVLKHGIMWTDLAARVASNEGVDTNVASALVTRLIEREYCYVVVASALIELIVEKGKADGTYR